MASSLIGRVSTLTSPRNFAKTDAEVGQIIRWYLADKAGPMPEGLTQAQQNQWYLDQYMDELVKHTVREARRNRLKILRDAQQSIEEQADNETSL